MDPLAKHDLRAGVGLLQRVECAGKVGIGGSRSTADDLMMSKPQLMAILTKCYHPVIKERMGRTETPSLS